MVLMRDILLCLVNKTVATPVDSYADPTIDWTQHDWSIFSDMANYHRVTAVIAHRMLSGECTVIPEPWYSTFVKSMHRTRLQHALALQRLNEVATAFHGEGIPCLPLKGPQLSDEVYPASGLRSFDDLDFLVDTNRRNDAESILREVGYRPMPGTMPLNLLKHYHFHSQWLHHQTHQVLELHWRPADYRTLPSISQTYRNPNYLQDLQENPAAMAVYLAVHLAKHGIFNGLIMQNRLPPLVCLHPWCDTRLIWLIDFSFTVSARNLKAAQLEEVANAWNCRSALDICLYLNYLTQKEPITMTTLLTASHATSRASIKGRLLNHIETDLRKPAAWPNTPWWLKANSMTGFRPVRLLDITSNK